MIPTIPVFNLLVNVWFTGNTPLAGPPDLLDLPAQLYINTRIGFDAQPGSRTSWFPPIWIRIASGSYTSSQGDIFEVDAGSGFYYKHRMWERIHLGFPNEYWAILVDTCTDNGTTPRP